MRPAYFAFLAGLLFLSAAAPAAAGERQVLGFGRLFTNDLIGDRDDRWRTGSYVFSLGVGRRGLTERPQGFGEFLEFRLGTAVIAPSNLTTPSPADRRYAGALSFGVHSHFTWGDYDVSAGADLVALGPQTGLDAFQTWVHQRLGVTAPSPAVRAAQVPNAFYPTALVELARPLELSNRLTFRPFIEAQAGVETFLRAGGDLMIGRGFGEGIYVRDVTTGQLYQTMRAEMTPGLSVLLGADTAGVLSSGYFPAGDPVQASPTRSRARAGLQWQSEQTSVFYGMTWLGPEFTGQPSGQVVGSLNIRLLF